MKKIVGLCLGVLWTGVVGAAELNMDFTFAPEDVTLTAVNEYTAVGLADGSRVMDEVGAPSIPAKFVNILIPAGAQNVSVSASGDLTLLAEAITPYPAQPRSPKSKPRPPFVSANARYASAAAWPAEVATYQGDHDMQGYRFISVRLNPLAYVGAEKKLYLRGKITVTVTYDAAAATRTILAKQKNAFASLVDSLVVNPEADTSFAPATRTTAPRATVDYLVITSSGLSNAFQQIASYRASSAGGSYNTRVVTTNTIASDYSGTDMQAKIRACISNAVSTLGTTMVLLGGDDTIVPVRYCSVSVVSGDTYETNMPTDLYYSGLGGSWNSDGDSTYGETNDSVDMAWDVVVGRLPMRTTAQVTNYLAKVTAYEAGSPVTNKIILGGPEAWLTCSGSDRPSDDVTIDGHAGFRSVNPAHTSVSDSEMWLRRLYRDGIHPYWPAQVGIMCDTLTSWDTTTNCGSWAQTEANTKTAFNKNWTHLMFSGHGEPLGWGLESGEFYNTDASSLTGMAAFVYTDACLTGGFDKDFVKTDAGTSDEYTYTNTDPCLGESFLRNANTLGGALVYMGCARYGWGEPDGEWNGSSYEGPFSNTSDGGPSTVYAYKFYKRMYETTDRTLGTAFAMHKADMVSLCSSNEAERWIQFGLNLLGDPALKMPTGEDTPSAPVFGANPGPVSATTGVAKTFTVSASGYPTPTLSLLTQTASSGYTFSTTTGVLTYTPPTNDVGAQTFTFRATNTQGTATQTVSVTVYLAPPQAPAAIWASVTNATTFTATWSTASGATSYRLDVGTNNTFSAGGGGGGGTNISENIQSWTAHGSYGNWTETIATGTVSMTDCIVQPTASASGVGSIGRVQLKASTGIVELPAINTAGTVTMNIAAGGADRTAKLQKYNGSTWDDLTTWTGIGATGAAFSYAVNDSGASVQLRIASPSAAIYVHDIIVTASGGGSTPAYVAGYSNRTVAGTSESVTGLTGAVTYYFRARAVNAIGTSGNSSVAQVTTKSGMSDQTISAFLPTNGSAFAASAAVGLSATASSGLAVTFAVASGPGTVNGTNLTFTGAGSVAVVASQAGNGSWNPAPNVTNTYSVSKASATVTLGSLDQAYDGTARPVTVVTAPAGLGVTVTYAGHSWAPTNVGTYAVTATVSDAVYQGSGSGTLTVTEAIQPGTVSSNAVVVTFGPLVNGSNYVLEYRASLTTGTWVEVANVTGTGTANATVTNVTGAADFGYYRVEGVAGPSAELLGYARVDKPGNGKLNVVGVPFLSSNQTLNSLMDPLQFTGHYNNAGQADQLMLWNPATTSYVNLALYDLRSFGAQYATNTGWKTVAGFGPGAAYTNPVLPAGSAVWIRGATTNDQKVAIAGAVVMTGAATNAIVAGLQLVANPFSEQVALSNLAIRVNAEGHYNNAGQADQIMVWDAGSQGYQNLALYDLRSFGAEYDYLTGWKTVAGFGPTSAYVNVTLKPGQGFWFKAVNGSFQWVESNDYKAGLE